jgi:hypothetical protein
MPSPHNDAPVKRIYLAGPMRGYPEFNFPTFNAVAWALRQDGHEVFNPAEKDIERHGGVDISKGNNSGSIEQAAAEHKFSLRDALSQDLHYICNHADMIALLPGWETSNGSRAEHATAVALRSGNEGMEILYLTQEVVDLMKAGYQLEAA